MAGLAVAPIGAQTATDPAEPVSIRPDGAPWSDAGFATNTAPSMSADGSLVAFDADTAGGPRVTIRDRFGGTTAPIVEDDSSGGTISGDGCVVAYSGRRTTPNGEGYQLLARNRCTDGAEQLVAELAAAAPLPPPAVSHDGTVLAWSDGDEIHRYAAAGAGFDETIVDGPDAAMAVGTELDLSADGGVLVFTAGPGTTAAPSPANVYAWRAGAEPQLVTTTESGDPTTGVASDPTVSADGTLVAFESTASDLALADTPPTVVPANGIVAVADLGAGVTRPVAEQATNPDLSADGRHLAFDRAGGVRVATWTGEVPFETVTETLVSTHVDGSGESAGASISGPVVSRHGRWVAFDAATGTPLTDDAAFLAGTHVWARERTPVLTIDRLDLGAVVVGASADDVTTVRNTGPSGLELVPPTAEAPFEVVATSCGAVLDPGSECQVTVRFTATGVGQASGTVTVSGGTPAVTFTGLLIAGGVEPATTSTTTTTVAPTTTTTFRPPTTPPRRTPPRTTVPPRRPPTTATSTTAIAAPEIAFVPDSVDLGRVVAGTGVARIIATLMNTGDDEVVVDALSISPSSASGFEVGDTTCASAIPAGGTCQVTVEFRSDVVGSFTATLTATTTTATAATATLMAVAVDPPTLVVEPGVAGNGQVVTVVGAGFPAATDLAVVVGADPRPLAILTDDSGSFRLPFVVPARTPSGPLQVVVAGVSEVFPTTQAAVLVTGAGDRSPSPVLAGVGSPVGG